MPSRSSVGECRRSPVIPRRRLVRDNREGKTSLCVAFPPGDTLWAAPSTFVHLRSACIIYTGYMRTPATQDSERYGAAVYRPSFGTLASRRRLPTPPRPPYALDSAAASGPSGGRVNVVDSRWMRLGASNVSAHAQPPSYVCLATLAAAMPVHEQTCQIDRCVDDCTLMCMYSPGYASRCAAAHSHSAAAETAQS